MRRRAIQYSGAWKVAYADFITAMMALFLVLWLTAQDAKIKEAVERAFRNPHAAVNKESTGIIPNPDDNPSAQHRMQGRFQSPTAVEMEMLRKVSDDLAHLLKLKDEEQKTVQLELTPDGLRVNIFDRSHKPIFQPESAEFTEYGAWVFSTLAWEIARYHSFKIELEGHTEKRDQPVREARGKWEITTERANAARRKLVQNGVVATQIFKVSGFADTQPMPRNVPTAEVNRRVTVLLRVDTSDATAETASLSSDHERATR